MTIKETTSLLGVRFPKMESYWLFQWCYGATFLWPKIKWVTGVKCHPCKWSLEPAYLHLVMGPTSPLTQLQGEALHQHLQDSQASLSFCSAKEFFKKATWMCVDKSQGGNENKGSVVSPNRTMLKHQPQKQHNPWGSGCIFFVLLKYICEGSFLGPTWNSC